MRFYTMAVMTVGIILLFNLAGMSTPLGGGLTKQLGIVDSTNTVTNNIESSNLYGGGSESNKGLKWLLLIGLISGLTIGLIGGAPDIRYITAAIVWAIVSALTTDLLAIVNMANIQDGYIGSTIMIIMGGWLVALYISAIQFWQGVD